jgi:hypothetical protein
MMLITTNHYSIAEISEMIARHDLIINRDYQRGSALWPIGARSYFIDTIINNYPFPKIYFYETLDSRDRLRREIVDGQQRVSTILDYMDGGFALSASDSYPGSKFEDLEPDVRQRFLRYAVAVDVIRDATQADIVEMFRRMNAYTLPLNDAEKRHAAFQGQFKWTINALAGDLSEFFSEFGVFTKRQMVRMADQEMLTEVFLFGLIGNFSSSPPVLRDIYKDFDKEFPQATAFSEDIKSAVAFVFERLPRLHSSFMVKPYAFYTLMCALLYNNARTEIRYETAPPAGQFAVNSARAEARLLELAEAHEAKELDGPYEDYVRGCLSGTNRVNQREQRFNAVLEALQLA